jgi:hypothetical protein
LITKKEPRITPASFDHLEGCRLVRRVDGEDMADPLPGKGSPAAELWLVQAIKLVVQPLPRDGVLWSTVLCVPVVIAVSGLLR